MESLKAQVTNLTREGIFQGKVVIALVNLLIYHTYKDMRQEINCLIFPPTAIYNINKD